VAETLDPSVLDARMVAEPTATAVTTPFETVAMDGFNDVHDRVLLVALLGVTVATNCKVCVGANDKVVGRMVIPVTDTAILDTVTVAVALRFEPSVLNAVMVAEPPATAVTTPFDTVATDELLEDQLRDGLVAFDGDTVAVRVDV